MVYQTYLHGPLVLLTMLYIFETLATSYCPLLGQWYELLYPVFWRLRKGMGLSYLPRFEIKVVFFRVAESIIGTTLCSIFRPAMLVGVAPSTKKGKRAIIMEVITTAVWPRFPPLCCERKSDCATARPRPVNRTSDNADYFLCMFACTEDRNGKRHLARKSPSPEMCP